MPRNSSGPMAARSPFRGEKGLGWEGGFRAPFVMRWPGRFRRQVLNGIFSLEDVVPTVMAAAGVPDIKEQLLKGYQAAQKHFHVHLDGYNQLPYLTGETTSRRGTSFSTTVSTICSPSATRTGRSTSWSRMTGSPGNR